MATELPRLSKQLDGDLQEMIIAQENTIADLTDQIRVLVGEKNSQAALLSMLKTANENLRKRALDLIKANEEIREVTTAYLNIATQLRHRVNLSTEEKEILQSSERARMLLQCTSYEKTISEPDIQLGSESLTRKPTLVFPPPENRVSDVTILSRKKSIQKTEARSFSDEHPNMKILLKFPLFASFPQNIMELVSLTSYEMRRKAGQIIVNKGEEGAEIFFLTEGTVAVMLDDKSLSVLQPPIFFGELGVLFKFQRTASVIAKTDATMVVVTKQKLDQIVSGHPEVKELVEFFSSNKEMWWKKQQYVSSQEKFGAEFVHHIAISDIRKVAIFQNAPDSFLDSLAMTIKCIVFQPNQNIITIDEESDAMYFLLSGSVEVVGSTGVVHAEISAGSFFGEVGVLLNMKRTASIRAKSESNILKLFKKDLDSVMEKFPSMNTVVKDAADERYKLFKQRTESKTTTSDQHVTTAQHVPDQFDMEVAGQSLSKLSLFNGVEKSVLSELGMKMIRKTWEKGELIIKCGAVGDSMFFLAAGNAEVVTEFGEMIDTASGPTAYFGEVAILEQVPRTATVRCISTCSTYELRKDDFMAVISNHPAIAAQIKETADLRMQKYLMRNVLA